MWHTGFDGVPDAGQVDVDHVCPVVLTGLVQGRSAVADSCVGDNDVESAQLLNTAVDHGLERVVVAHVHLGGHDAAVLCLDQIGGLGQVVGRGGRDLAF